MEAQLELMALMVYCAPKWFLALRLTRPVAAWERTVAHAEGLHCFLVDVSVKQAEVCM